MRRRRLLAEGMQLLSQLRTDYRRSPLSEDGDPPRTGSLRAGDRLPDTTVSCDGRRVQVHGLLAAPGLHLLLDRDARHPGPLGARVHVHRLTDRHGEGVTAVRPDGYVGFRSGRSDGDALLGWLRRVGGLARAAVPA
jgi:hypothetical protein